MIIRNLKYKLKSKEFKLIFIMSILFYIGLYIIIKNEFFYNAIQYNATYIRYYIDKYLGGNINDLIFNNNVYMYIESDVQNIFSSLYLYVASHNNVLFLFFNILISFIIFHLMSTKYYCEIFNKYFISQITRIGKRKYIFNTIITNSIYFGLILAVPRLLYFVLLSVFFPVGISTTHFITTTSFISDKFLYVGYNCSPFVMIGLDILISFIFGVILGLISLIISTSVKNRPISYLVYILTFVSLSIIPWKFMNVPFIFYSSIYQYFSNFYEVSIELNVYQPFLSLIILLCICIIGSFIILNKKVVDNT